MVKYNDNDNLIFSLLIIICILILYIIGMHEVKIENEKIENEFISTIEDYEILRGYEYTPYDNYEGELILPKGI